MKICAVIPAAGRGTRLGVDCPKILVPIDGDKTIWSILRNLLIDRVDRIHIVLSSTGQPLFHKVLAQDDRRDHISTSIQREPLGMGDAIFGAQPAWRNFDTILIVWGDQVNLSEATIKRITAICGDEKTIVLPLTQLESPYVQYDLSGSRLTGVRQKREGDTVDARGASDVGLFALSVKGLSALWSQYLQKSESGAQTGEINFLPFLVYLSQQGGWAVKSIEVADPVEARGVNTPEDLQFARTRWAAH